MKREIKKYDFKAFGQAIKEARKAKEISRNQLADQMHIAPRYIASIENSGQHPSLQIFYVSSVVNQNATLLTLTRLY
ncbi:helix-turn-helix transcriptional regulator [uncultured Clostridium sp.]|uniref:helix-turn-helix domain-containing protein n=1 Tax=uncultured Clostridium sp. TaxID=59620 RepID=UPI0028F00CF0|nr:helix-turn-helix transcriptional regulator [uncultured Clostridium sp.]